MSRLSRFLPFCAPLDCQGQATLKSTLTFVLLWILAAVVSEGLEELAIVLELSFAVAQWLVLRRYLRRISGWILVSMWGWTLAVIIIHVFGLGPWLERVLGSGLGMSLGVVSLQISAAKVLARTLEWTVIGGCQWLLLRRYLYQASGWIVASAWGGAMKGIMDFAVLAIAPKTIAALAGASTYGVITGISLLFILRPMMQTRHNQSWLSKRNPGPEHRQV